MYFERLLTQRLVAKNAELKKLYEELRLLNSLFLKGKTTYEDKVKAIREVIFKDEPSKLS